jgi:phosphatidylglycerophosphate synthase
MRNILSKTHHSIYSRLNNYSFNKLTELDKNGKIPKWLTADNITSGRLGLVFPSIITYSQGYTWLPASLILMNAGLDYVDGAVARWEQTIRPKSSISALGFNNNNNNDKIIISNRLDALHKYWGAYFDAGADKIFAIPVWVAITALNPTNFLLQSICLTHASIETFSSFTRTKSFYLHPEASNVVVADFVGKTKQFVSMLGTAMVLIPSMKITGTILLGASLPLALLSLKNKLASTNQKKPQVIYYQLQNSLLGNTTTTTINTEPQTKSDVSSVISTFDLENIITLRNKYPPSGNWILAIGLKQPSSPSSDLLQRIFPHFGSLIDVILLQSFPLLDNKERDEFIAKYSIVKAYVELSSLSSTSTIVFDTNSLLSSNKDNSKDNGKDISIH